MIIGSCTMSKWVKYNNIGRRIIADLVSERNLFRNRPIAVLQPTALFSIFK